jgi:FkbM family methyltransferase
MILTKYLWRARLTFRQALRFIAVIVMKLGDKVYQSDLEKNVALWNQDRGNETHRLQYEGISRDSLVLDVGGYKGQWASDIYAMYRCRIYIIEPVEQFAEIIKKRFTHNLDISVFATALSDENRIGMISMEQNASSLLKKANECAQIDIVDVVDFFKENNIESVAIMKINIEGAEYKLLERILNSELVEKIQNLQIQFHDFIPNAEEKKKLIQKKLSHTHICTYEYPFVWENWRLK